MHLWRCHTNVGGTKVRSTDHVVGRVVVPARSGSGVLGTPPSPLPAR